ncbi:hypothetical protein [Azospirillum halopraeferens]|nr:hypothetical protein [Azospirillum halopraeferens]
MLRTMVLHTLAAALLVAATAFSWQAHVHGEGGAATVQSLVAALADDD